MVDLDIFKARLRESRLVRGFTQESLANEVGVGESTIANYESGRNGPKPPVLKKLATALEVDPEYLIGESTSDQSDEDEMKFNPTIEAMIQQLMEEGGYDTKKELISALVREKAGGQPIASKQPKPEPEPGSLEASMQDLNRGIEEMKERHRKAFGGE